MDGGRVMVASQALAVGGWLVVGWAVYYLLYSLNTMCSAIVCNLFIILQCHYSPTHWCVFALTTQHTLWYFRSAVHVTAALNTCLCCLQLLVTATYLTFCIPYATTQLDQDTASCSQFIWTIATPPHPALVPCSCLPAMPWWKLPVAWHAAVPIAYPPCPHPLPYPTVVLSCLCLPIPHHHLSPPTPFLPLCLSPSATSYCSQLMPHDSLLLFVCIVEMDCRHLYWWTVLYYGVPSPTTYPVRQ